MRASQKFDNAGIPSKIKLALPDGFAEWYYSLAFSFLKRQQGLDNFPRSQKKIFFTGDSNPGGIRQTITNLDSKSSQTHLLLKSIRRPKASNDEADLESFPISFLNPASPQSTKHPLIT